MLEAFQTIYNTGMPLISKPYCRNIYVDEAGILRPMPFDTKADGLWHFDGQVFYQKKVA